MKPFGPLDRDGAQLVVMEVLTDALPLGAPREHLPDALAPARDLDPAPLDRGPDVHRVLREGGGCSVVVARVEGVVVRAHRPRNG